MLSLLPAPQTQKLPSNIDANWHLQYWDSITKEDLEFSVGTKAANWEVKELLPEEDRRNTYYEDTSSLFHSQHGRYSTLGSQTNY